MDKAPAMLELVNHREQRRVRRQQSESDHERCDAHNPPQQDKLQPAIQIVEPRLHDFELLVSHLRASCSATASGARIYPLKRATWMPAAKKSPGSRLEPGTRTGSLEEVCGKSRRAGRPGS